MGRCKQTSIFVNLHFISTLLAPCSSRHHIAVLVLLHVFHLLLDQTFALFPTFYLRFVN